MKQYLFDLDGTLINTSALKPHRKTNEGRRYVASSPNSVQTDIYSSHLVDLVNRLNKEKCASVITNSPLDYSKALLKKHGYDDIPVHAGLEKPDTELLMLNITNRESMIIGDTALDILTAHECNFCSTAVLWGDDSQEQLVRSEPSKIASRSRDLDEIINEFESGKISYNERQDPKNYNYLSKPSLNDPEVMHFYLNDYHSESLEKKPIVIDDNYKFAAKILRFKEAKNSTMQDIKNNARSYYFNKGRVKGGEIFKIMLLDFYKSIAEKIGEMDLKGKSAMIAAPNSFPEYCYKSDISQSFAKKINKDIFGNDFTERFVFRVHPKKESHSGGIRTGNYWTMGIKKGSKLPDADNILIFDDIYTTGSQTRAIAHILRELAGFNGNLYCLTLGKTYHADEAA